MAPRRRAPVAGRPGGSPAWALLVLVLGLARAAADAEPGPSGPCSDPLARALAELASWAGEHCDVVLGAGASGAAKSVSDVCLEWQAQTSPQSEVAKRYATRCDAMRRNVAQHDTANVARFVQRHHVMLLYE